MGIVSIERIEPAGHLSKAVVHNGTVYLAGLIADDDSLNVGGQTKQVLDKIDRYLAEAGSNKTKLLSTVIYLTDISLKDAVDEHWIPWIGDGHQPARACVGGAQLATPKLQVEIMVTAAI